MFGVSVLVIELLVVKNVIFIFVKIFGLVFLIMYFLLKCFMVLFVDCVEVKSCSEVIGKLCLCKSLISFLLIVLVVLMMLIVSEVFMIEFFWELVNKICVFFGIKFVECLFFV